jgi:predicted ATP-grasp superfamily ATP-dependent carboligase
LKVFIVGGEGGVALTVVQSLGRMGVSVVIGSIQRKPISSFSKYGKIHFQYPDPQEYPEEFLQCIVSKVEKEKYDVLLALGGKGMLLISEHRDRFLPFVKIPLPDHEILQKANNKAETLKIAIEHNIPCPKTYFIQDVEEVKKILDELTFPVILKPTEGSGSKGLEYIIKKENLIEIFEKTSQNFGETILQELIPPGGEAYGFEGLFNKNSEPRAIFVHQRLREYPITGGPSTLRVGVKNEEIVELGTRLLKALGWYGIAMVEFKVDPRDNTPKLMEINPRFWGSLSLPVASGVDFPYLLCKMALDGDVDILLEYKTGIKSRWLFYGDVKYFIAVLKGYSTPWGYKSPGRIKTILEFLKFYEKDTTYDFLSWDDPVPGIIKIFSPVVNKLYRSDF